MALEDLITWSLNPDLIQLGEKSYGRDSKPSSMLVNSVGSEVKKKKKCLDVNPGSAKWSLDNLGQVVFSVPRLFIFKIMKIVVPHCRLLSGLNELIYVKH